MKKILDKIKEADTADIILLAIISSIILLFLISIGIYSMIKWEHSKNGMKSGVVLSYKYKPRSEEATVTSSIDVHGNPTMNIEEEEEPESYSVVVSDGNGREELWKTYKSPVDIKVGDTLYIENSWEWIGTLKVKDRRD
jgi:co-chaperonin GroES (HSP10)